MAFTPKVIITSPSLNASENVSGISSLVGQIVKYPQLNIEHFELGSKDGQYKGVKWAFNQVLLYGRMVYICLFGNVEVVHLNVGLEKMGIIRDYFLMVISKLVFNKKLFLHLHGGYYLMHEPTSKLLAGMVRGLINNADLIAVLSELEEQTLTGRYGPKNFYVLPNAVEGSSDTQVNNRPANEPIELVFMGRVNKTKGIFVLVEALKQLSGYYHRFSFAIYGAGPDLPQFLAQLAECLQLDYAYRGVAKGDDKWRVLHQADVMLLPSIHSEGMPMVILESMAANCLVISTDDASIRTVIKDGINGLIVPKSDSAALAAKIRDVLDGKVDRFALAAQAQTLIAQHYTMAQYMTKLEAGYRNVMQQ